MAALLASAWPCCLAIAIGISRPPAPASPDPPRPRPRLQVWPERSSSAAGVRTSDLIASFQERGWAAAFASSSSPNDHTAALAAAGVATHQCPPNRAAALEAILAEARPTAVVFDRFYAEEAFRCGGGGRLQLRGRRPVAHSWSRSAGGPAQRPGALAHPKDRPHARGARCGVPTSAHAPTPRSFRVRELAPSALRILDMQDFHALRAARQRAAEAGLPLADVLAAWPDTGSAECLRELAAIHR